MADKKPSFQFYPGDWRKDPELARATKAEKGMLIDLLCLMHESEDRGVLATSGEQWTDSDIVSAVGGDRAESLALLRGLLRKGILRRNKSGSVFSTRMVRDEQKRKLCTEAGKKGGNPTLNRQSKGGVKGQSKRNPTPSSSASSSASDSTSKEKAEAVAPAREFVPPTAQEVKIYGQMIGYDVDGELFVANYAARGWKDGQGQPVTDWRPLVTKWKIREGERRRDERRQEGGTNGRNSSGGIPGHIPGGAAPKPGPRILD